MEHRRALLSRSLRLGSFPLLLGLVACGSAAGVDVPDEFDSTSAVREPIIGGSKASAYPEAALIDMSINGQTSAACSGSVIAPRVVLTAGHCILGVNGWKVTVPYAGKQSKTSKSAVTPYKGQGGSVDPNTQDVGLIFLDAPIDLPSYPKIATSKLPNGSKAMNIGRINNGSFSSTDLFVSQPLSLSDAASYGFPYDYIAKEIIQSGDSGGPVILSGSNPHTIVAVNSGAGGGTEVLARTDLLAAWIADQIAKHGGPGDSGAGGSGSGGNPGSGGSGNAGSGNAGSGAGGSGNPGGPSCAGTPEAEPNDAKHPSPIAGTSCGSLSAGDEDWYRWTVAGPGVHYVVEVTGGDAEVLMWKYVGGYFYPIANQTPQRIENTSNGPGPYHVAVWSPTGSTGAYSIKLTTK